MSANIKQTFGRGYPALYHSLLLYFILNIAIVVKCILLEFVLNIPAFCLWKNCVTALLALGASTASDKAPLQEIGFDHKQL